jgi:hypothetical protein
MAYADRIAQPELGLQFVLRISGLPYLFSNAPAPIGWESSGTVTYDSEDYTWSSTLLIPDDFASISQKIQPKGGLGESGGLSFEFQTEGTGGDIANDLWLDLMTTNLGRTDKDYTTLTADIDVDELTVINTALNPWGTAGQTLYVGTETIKTTGTGSTASPTTSPAELKAPTTRGAYGSKQQHHRASTIEEAEQIIAGVVISDFPRSLAGRYVEMWVITGQMYTTQVGSVTAPSIASVLGQGFQPYGDLDTFIAMADPEHKKVYAGVIAHVGWTPDLMSVVVESKSLLALIEGPVATRFPTFRAGMPDAAPAVGGGFGLRQPGAVYLDTHNNSFPFVVYDDEQRARITIVDVTALIAAIGAGTVTITVGDKTLTGVTTTSAWSGVANTFHVYTVGDVDTQAYLTAQYIDNDIWFNAPYSGGVLSYWLFAHRKYTIFLEVKNNLSASDVALSTSGDGGALYVSGSTLAEVDGYTYDGVLRRDDGASGYEDVPSGRYSVGDLGNYIRDTFLEQIGGIISVNAIAVFTEDDDEREERRAYLTVRITPGDVASKWAVDLYTVKDRRESVLRDLGFKDEVLTGTLIEDASEEAVFEFRATRAPAIFRLPAQGQGTPPKLFLWDHEPGSWHTDNIGGSAVDGWTDDDGTSLNQFFQIEGSEVIECDGTYTSDATWGGGYVVPVARGVMGSWGAKEVYIPLVAKAKQKYAKVQRIPAFPGVNVARMFLFLLHGSTGVGATNSIYDEGWEGVGFHIPSRFIESSSFLDAHAEAPRQSRRDNWCIFPKDKARDVFNDELVICQWQLVAHEGQIHCVAIRPPLEARLTSVPTLTHDDNLSTDLSGSGVSLDASNVRLVNVIDAKGGYNNGTGKYALEIKNKSLDSIVNHGARPALALKVRGIRSTGDIAPVVRAVAKRIFDRYGEPYAVIEGLGVTAREPWGWQLGSAVKLTHDALPATTTADRGVTELASVVMGSESHFMGRTSGESQVHATLSLIAHPYKAARHSEWAPSARGLSTSDGGLTWAIDDDRYGDGDPKDVEYFQAGWVVEVWKVGEEVTKLQRTIASISVSGTPNASTIKLTLTTTYTVPVIFRLVDYDDAGAVATQQAYAYLSGGDGTLDGGAALAFKYV